MFCHKCGSKSLEDAAFCQECGTKLIIEETSQQMSDESTAVILASESDKPIPSITSSQKEDVSIIEFTPPSVMQQPSQTTDEPLSTPTQNIKTEISTEERTELSKSENASVSVELSVDKDPEEHEKHNLYNEAKKTEQTSCLQENVEKISKNISRRAIIGGVAVLMLIIAFAIITNALSNSVDKDYFRLDSHKIPTVHKVLGSRGGYILNDGTITGGSSGTTRMLEVINYSSSDAEQDMLSYARTLQSEYGFHSLNIDPIDIGFDPYKVDNDTFILLGKNVSFGNYLAVLIEKNWHSGFDITYIKRKGELRTAGNVESALSNMLTTQPTQPATTSESISAPEQARQSAAMSDEEFFELCRSGTPQEIQAAIQRGSDVNSQGRENWTPLIFAARDNPNPESLSVLIKAGADVNFVSENTWTPLKAAARWNENPQVISVLVKAGANIDAREGRRTALMWAAAESSNPLVISALLDAGADVHAVSRDDNKKALDFANENSALQRTYAYDRLELLTAQSSAGRISVDQTNSDIPLAGRWYVEDPSGSQWFDGGEEVEFLADGRGNERLNDFSANFTWQIEDNRLIMSYVEFDLKLAYNLEIADSKLLLHEGTGPPLILARYGTHVPYQP